MNQPNKTEYNQGGLWQRYQNWQRGLSQKQRVRYGIFWLVILLSLAIIGIWAAVSAWIRPPDLPKVPSTDLAIQTPISPGEEGQEGVDFGGELPHVSLSGRKQGVYTFLVVGQDTAGGGNTDTMILLTFDSVGKKLYGMSLPRDTMINVKTSSKRLNAVYNYNKGRDRSTQMEKGMAALKKEVGKLTGIVPDFYVVVQWEAVGKLVDALGGVFFDVPFDMDYDDPTPGQELHIHIKKGYQKLNGEQAMGLIRWRHNNSYSVQYPTGDLGRIKTQQDFLKAVAQETLKPSTILRIPSLAQIFVDNVDTDLTMGNLLALAQQAIGVDVESGITFVTMPNQDARYPSASMVLPIVDELLEIINQGFNPYLDQIRLKDLQVLQRNGDGSYRVTSGTLEDASLGRPRKEPEPEETEEGEPEEVPPPADVDHAQEIVPPSVPEGVGSDQTPLPPVPEGGESGQTPLPPVPEGGESGQTPLPPVPEGGEGGQTPLPPVPEGGEGGQTPPPPVPDGGENSQLPSLETENIGSEESVSEETEGLAPEQLPQEPTLGTGDVEGVFPELPSAQ